MACACGSRELRHESADTRETGGVTYRDRLSYGGAWMTAVEIMGWWKERGFLVHAWVEPLPIRHAIHRPVYMVRSDLLNGAPRARAA